MFLLGPPMASLDEKWLRTSRAVYGLDGMSGWAGGRSTAPASTAPAALRVSLLLRRSSPTVGVRTWPWSSVSAESCRVGSTETPKKGFVGVVMRSRV